MACREEWGIKSLDVWETLITSSVFAKTDCWLLCSNKMSLFPLEKRGGGSLFPSQPGAR